MRVRAKALVRRLSYSHDDADRACRSVQSFGFGCLPNAIAGHALAALEREAEERLDRAAVAEQSASLRYRARIAPLGPEASGLLSCDETRALLLQVLGQPVALSEARSCLTIYGAGDHLGPHLDEPANECAVTMLVYVATSGPDRPSPDTGLVLNVFSGEPGAGTQPCLSIPTHGGSIVIGRGSTVWHERPPLLPGERVVALTACFALAGSKDGLAEAAPRLG